MKDGEGGCGRGGTHRGDVRSWVVTPMSHGSSGRRMCCCPLTLSHDDPFRCLLLPSNEVGRYAREQEEENVLQHVCVCDWDI